MNLTELKAQLQTQPGLTITIALPDGGRVPAHFHITEVGHLAKRFIDCGGTIRTSETCVLQTYFGSPKDDGHRLTSGKLAKILDLAQPILPSDELPVEVEYEEGVISQFPLAEVTVDAGGLVLQLGLKHTDCLAKDKCGITADDAEDGERCCVGSATSGGCC